MQPLRRPLLLMASSKHVFCRIEPPSYNRNICTCGTRLSPEQTDIGFSNLHSLPCTNHACQSDINFETHGCSVSLLTYRSLRVFFKCRVLHNVTHFYPVHADLVPSETLGPDANYALMHNTLVYNEADLDAWGNGLSFKSLALNA